MPRRIALLACLLLIAASAASSAAEAQPLDDACAAASPSAAACLGAQKLAELGSAQCRAAGASEDACAGVPAGRQVRPSRLAAYRSSWLHRAAALQFALGDSVPLRDAQWLGTHNSFNANANGFTLSHTDSNQQLSLTQQLDGDIRSIELDLHFVPGVTAGGAGSRVLRVCHARGADQAHAGCTTEPLFADVLPEIRAWLRANPTQVILLYLEDQIGDPAGYAQATAALGDLVYHPQPARAQGCTELPLTLTRAQVLAAGKQVLAVGNCVAGWSGSVYGWNQAHTEAGNTSEYQAYPTCNPKDDTSKLVRYFEDSTWLSAAVAPTETPAGYRARSLTPQKVATMTRCGVELFGFDQFDPEDGRVAASIWSWAPDELPAPGACTAQEPDGRWHLGSCRRVLPAACRTDTGWALTSPVAAAAAASACRQRGTFDPPRTGLENARLRDLAGDRVVWIAA